MLSQVKPGMTYDQVMRLRDAFDDLDHQRRGVLLCVPDDIAAGGVPAAYIVDRTVVVVYFDKGKVSRVANYGLKDGVVFDSVSRTTPTAGSELNFLSQLIRGMGKGSRADVELRRPAASLARILGPLRCRRRP